jgi:hypothetical protein
MQFKNLLKKVFWEIFTNTWEWRNFETIICQHEDQDEETRIISMNHIYELAWENNIKMLLKKKKLEN